MKIRGFLYSLMFLIIGQCFFKCTNPSLKTGMTNKNEISFDSLKISFNKGDKIIINDWILTGPKDFFDSVSISKKLFKCSVFNKDSSSFKYGNNGNNRFIRVEIPSMDSLPKGEFIDAKFFRYLNPATAILYLVNGEVVSNYSNFLNKIQNKRIKKVSTLDAKSAMSIWGNNYGKNGALIVEINAHLEAQKTFRPFNPTSIGRRICQIDSMEYFANKIPFQKINNSSTIHKSNGVIKVPFNYSSIEFKDNTDDENFVEYFIIGQNEKDKWICIKEQRYYQEYFYMIHPNSTEIDTLIGEPLIYVDKILCQEGSYTDGMNYIEIWDFQNNKLNLLKKFTLIPFGIITDEMYLNRDFLYARYNSNKYLKLKI